MTVQLTKALGLRPNETRRIGVVFLASFFLGASLMFFYTASNAIFLTTFSISTLPYMYITNAVFVILFGVVYAQLEKRLSFLRLLYGFNVMLALTILGFWFGLHMARGAVIIFVLMTWFRLLFIFTTLSLWELASRMFDVRQAKRLFALVGLGIMSAFIVGGLSMSAITQWVGTVNLLLISAGSLLVYVAILARELPKLGINFEKKARTSQNTPFVQLVKDRYVLLILTLKTFTVIIAYLVEFIFYALARQLYPGEKALADFLALFMAGSTLIMVLITAFLSGRYISRFGIRVALPTFPLIMILTALTAAVYGSFISIQGAFFALIAAIMFSNQVFEKSIYNPTSAVLYQPMPPQTRANVRVAVEGWFGSVALIASGLLLLIFDSLSKDNLTPFVWLLVVVSALFMAITVLTYREYAAQLRAAITTRFLNGVRLDDAGQPGAEWLHSQLQSEHPGAISAAFAYLERIGEIPDDMLVTLLRSAAPEIQVMLLERIEHRRYYPALPHILPLITRGLNLTVREQALITAAALEGEHLHVGNFLRGDLQKAALVGGLRYGDLRLQGPLVEQLHTLIRADDPKSRRMAAQVITQSKVNRGEIDALLLTLLQDTDHETAAEAIRACADPIRPELLSTMISRLDQMALRGVLIQTLSLYGERLLRQARRDFSAYSPLIQRGMIQALGRSGHPDALTFLRAQMERDQGSLYPQLLKALSLSGYREEEDSLFPFFEREKTHSQTVTELLKEMPKKHVFLRTALQELLRDSRDRVCSLLILCADPSKIRDVQHFLQQEQTEARATALEALDTMLSPRLKRAALPLLEETAENIQPTLPEAPPEVQIERIRSLILDAQASLMGEWVRFTARYTLDQIRGHRGELSAAMYTTIEPVIILRSVSIFARTPDSILAEIAPMLTERTAGPGDIVIRQGEIGDQLYIIVHGEVQVMIGAKVINTLGDRSIFGEMAVLDPAPRTATVTALRHTQLFVLDQTTLYDLISARPEILRGIMGVLVARLRHQSGEMGRLEG